MRGHRVLEHSGTKQWGWEVCCTITLLGLCFATPKITRLPKLEGRFDPLLLSPHLKTAEGMVNCCRNWIPSTAGATSIWLCAHTQTHSQQIHTDISHHLKYVYHQLIISRVLQLLKAQGKQCWALQVFLHMLILNPHSSCSWPSGSSFL